jgi:soluble lytic murein transglycosylase
LPPARAAADGAGAALALSDLPLEVRWLAALGLASDARDALRPHETALRRSHGALALSAILYEFGDPGRASRLAAQADELSRSASGEGARAWALAYPRAYEVDVSAAARAQGLDAELLWGIMRQESGYDPDALSYADAMGLLQLLPSTGERVAAGLGVPFRREMLFEPAWNARLGAAYVATQIRTHGVPLCFAAYNAGGHRVRAWLERTGEVDLDLFVEEIPFDQTRNYVRRVTSHVAHYLHAAHPDAGWPALDLPERVGPRADAPDGGDRDEPLEEGAEETDE